MKLCNLLPGGLICLAALMAPASRAAQIPIGQRPPRSDLDAGQARAYSTGLQMYLNRVNTLAALTATLLRCPARHAIRPALHGAFHRQPFRPHPAASKRHARITHHQPGDNT